MTPEQLSREAIDRRLEQAIVDCVNVGEDIFRIETEVSKQGSTVLKKMCPVRSASFDRNNCIASGHV